MATITQNKTRKAPTIPTQLSRRSAKDFIARNSAAPYPAEGISVVDAVFIVCLLSASTRNYIDT
jgi:hypothetical protein